MSNIAAVPIDVTHHVRDHCLCLFAQRAARVLARRFDEAFKPCGLTNGQFSLLMALNRPQMPGLGEVARLLGMDRTTLTAKLKPLERRGLLRMAADEMDRRDRRLSLTPEGRALLVKAVPIWTRTHAEIEEQLDGQADALRRGLQHFA